MNKAMTYEAYKAKAYEGTIDGLAGFKKKDVLTWLEEKEQQDHIRKSYERDLREYNAGKKNVFNDGIELGLSLMY